MCRESWEQSNMRKIISLRIIREHLYGAENVLDVENKIIRLNTFRRSKCVQLFEIILTRKIPTDYIILFINCIILSCIIFHNILHWFNSDSEMRRTINI